MFGENKKVWIYQCNKWLVFWLITALVTSQLFFKTSKFISVLWWGQFPGYWICDAVPFPYSGHFMLIRDPQRLRKMSSFDLLNKRLHLSGHVMSIIIVSSLSKCVTTCVTKIHCKSLNFRLKDKSCDLNDAGRHQKDYGPTAGFIYMDVSESPKDCPFNNYIPNAGSFYNKVRMQRALSLVERACSTRV